jgi:hypothetical protein
MKHQTKLTLLIGIATALVGLLILAITILFIPKTTEPFYHIFLLLKELGMATLIAGILVATIELASRARHEEAADELIEKINLNLLYATLKRRVPDSIFSEIREQILDQNFVREFLRLDYHINCPVTPDKTLPDGWFWTKQISEFKIVNISDEPKPLRIFVGFDSRISKNSPYFNNAIIESVLIDDYPQEINSPSNTATHGVVGKKFFEKRITVQGKQSVRIKSSTIGMKRSDRDSEAIICAYPTQKIEVTVVDHSKQKELNFYIDPLSPKAAPKPVEESELGKKRWDIEFAFLPGQGVEVVWCRNDFLQAAPVTRN